MKILIVGGAGYIGSHMVKYLGQRNIDVVTLDNLSTGHADAITHGQFIQADIRDPAQLAPVFAAHQFDAVIHFAALSIVGDSMTAPREYYENNVIGTYHLANAAVAAGVTNIVFSSTAAVYGNPARDTITEDDTLAPINPYGKTKLAVERMLQDYQAYGLNHVALRYFNAAGADPEGQLGERHDPETHLIPIILQAASGQRHAVSIFGADYDTPDGTCVRDYIHIVDLCQAHLQAVEYLMAGGQSASFNLGNGSGFSVRQVIDVVKKVTGKDFTVHEAQRRAGDPGTLVADASRARDVLGWKPEFAELETIVRHAWAFASQPHQEK